MATLRAHGVEICLGKKLGVRLWRPPIQTRGFRLYFMDNRAIECLETFFKQRSDRSKQYFGTMNVAAAWERGLDR